MKMKSAVMAPAPTAVPCLRLFKAQDAMRAFIGPGGTARL
jgi:hypothetical protein